MEKNVVQGIRDNLKGKKEFVNELRHYILSYNSILTLETGAYSETIEGILIKDITNSEQLGLGITILHVLASKEVDFQLHMHENQSQTISVLKGKIMDLESNIIFSPSESFFVGKHKNHRLRYFEDTELLVVYMPALKIL